MKRAAVPAQPADPVSADKTTGTAAVTSPSMRLNAMADAAGSAYMARGVSVGMPGVADGVEQKAAPPFGKKPEDEEPDGDEA